MKTPLKPLLLAIILHAAQIHAADGDLKPALDALHQRHTEALAAATAAATAAVEDEWYLGLKKLRLEAVAKNDGETTKKIEAMLLAAGRNGVSLGAAPAAAMAEEKKTGLPEKGSRWDGLVAINSTKSPEKRYDRVEATVSWVEGNVFTLRTSRDEGQIWDWTFKQEGGGIEVINFQRIRAGKNMSATNPAEGITGKGKMENGTMTFSFSWPQDESVLMGTFELKLAK